MLVLIPSRVCKVLEPFFEGSAEHLGKAKSKYEHAAHSKLWKNCTKQPQQDGVLQAGQDLRVLKRESFSLWQNEGKPLDESFLP